MTFVLLVRLRLRLLILRLTSSAWVLLLTRTVACFLATRLWSFSEVTFAPVAKGVRFFLTTSHRLLKHSLSLRIFSSLLLLNRCFLGLLLPKIFVVFLSSLVEFAGALVICFAHLLSHSLSKSATSTSVSEEAFGFVLVTKAWRIIAFSREDRWCKGT